MSVESGHAKRDPAFSGGGVMDRRAFILKSARAKLIAQRTDWRFLNEFKKELKG